jgi:hypothetical protein
MMGFDYVGSRYLHFNNRFKDAALKLLKCKEIALKDKRGYSINLLLNKKSFISDNKISVLNQYTFSGS